MPRSNPRGPDFVAASTSDRQLDPGTSIIHWARAARAHRIKSKKSRIRAGVNPQTTAFLNKMAARTLPQHPSLPGRSFRGGRPRTKLKVDQSQATPCCAVIFLGRNSAFRARCWPDSYRESTPTNHPEQFLHRREVEEQSIKNEIIKRQLARLYIKTCI